MLDGQADVLTVNMKCFEIFLLLNYQFLLYKLTVNMKCFEIKMVDSLKEQLNN